MNKFLVFILPLLLTSCQEESSVPEVSPSPTTTSEGWEIGPKQGFSNYSKGSVDGDTITIEDVHYITRAVKGPLSGTMSVTFTLDHPLVGTGCTTPATASLYFQQSGDDWETDGARWWATFATVTLDHEGVYSMTAPMNSPWTSVLTKNSLNAPEDFASAKSQPTVVGVTLGNCTGYGHGATGPAILKITSFQTGEATD